MTKTGSTDLSAIDDAETPGMASAPPVAAVSGMPNSWDETETTAAGDRVPREPDDA